VQTAVHPGARTHAHRLRADPWERTVNGPGPAGYNYDETISTLRYANRAKNIKNKPRINEDPKDAMLREFQVSAPLSLSLRYATATADTRCGVLTPAARAQEEIQRLKEQLTAAANGQPIQNILEGASERVVEIEKIVEVW
jgi:hypothetical protein